jgi:ER membrane protein complex subunit 3
VCVCVPLFFVGCEILVGGPRRLLGLDPKRFAPTVAHNNKHPLYFLLPTQAMMQFIQQFFSGFILLRVPFPLTIGFKSMFQRGLAELPDLDSSYVSSISWYFLVMYGLRATLTILMGEPSLELREQELLQTGSFGLQNPPGPGQTQKAEAMGKLVLAEVENLELLSPPKSDFDSVEKRLLGKERYPKKRGVSSQAEDDFLLMGGSAKNRSSHNKLPSGKKKAQ